MSIQLLIGLIIFLIVIGVFAYACVVVGARAEQRDDQMFQEWLRTHERKDTDTK